MPELPFVANAPSPQPTLLVDRRAVHRARAQLHHAPAREAWHRGRLQSARRVLFTDPQLAVAICAERKYRAGVGE